MANQYEFTFPRNLCKTSLYAEFPPHKRLTRDFDVPDAQFRFVRDERAGSESTLNCRSVREDIISFGNKALADQY